VSELVAALLLIAVTVAAAILLYTFAMGLLVSAAIEVFLGT
jgi:flagellin-like protein